MEGLLACICFVDWCLKLESLSSYNPWIASLGRNKMNLTQPISSFRLLWSCSQQHSWPLIVSCINTLVALNPKFLQHVPYFIPLGPEIDPIIHGFTCPTKPVPWHTSKTTQPSAFARPHVRISLHVWMLLV